MAKQSSLLDDDSFTSELEKALLPWYDSIDQATSAPAGPGAPAGQTDLPPLHPQPLRP